MTKITHLSVNEDGGRRRIHLREISGDSEAPLGTVGQDLRAARLRRGDDLATVSRSLKIRKDHLEAVEEDDVESLPGKTYAIGFVRSYATYLGLNTTETVERFKQEIAGRHDDHTPSASVMPDDDARRLPQGWRIVAGVVVLALIYGAWHLFSAGPSQQPVPPAPSLAPQHVVTAPPPPVEKQADNQAGAQAQSDNSQATDNQTGNSQTGANPSDNQTASVSPALDTAKSASNSPQPAAGAPAAKPAPSAKVPASAPPATATPTAAPSDGRVYGGKNKGSRVVLRVQGDTHIKVTTKDGMVFINRDLKAGDSYMVPNIPGLMLSSSNAGAVEINLDGQSMGHAGADAQVGDTELDPQAIADRHH